MGKKGEEGRWGWEERGAREEKGGVLGAAQGPVYQVGFSCACMYFFCAFSRNRQNKLHFSVSADFFHVCIVTHRKII